MFLLGNSRAAGLTDDGQPYQGTYVGAFEGEALRGVVCHAWNGMLLLQAPADAVELAREAVRLTGRELEGFTGPLEQVEAAAKALVTGPVLRSEREVLFTLKRGDLKVPPLAHQTRRPHPHELPLLAQWRYDYVVELDLDRPGEEARQDAEQGIARSHARGDLFVLEHEGRLVAKTAFNARIAEAVQIGGVYVPPSLRGRGYAKAVVAGQLLLANAPRALLFTGEQSHAAQAAYRAVGFERAGSYGLVLL